MKSLQSATTAKRFITGFLITGAAVAFLNLLPYIHSHRAYNGDGYEIVGFPLVFHRTGGFAYIHKFYPAALLADAAMAFLLALLLGIASSRVGFDRRAQSGD